MYSIWNAPSDRDYYDQNGVWEQEEDDDRCFDCGAGGDEACTEQCTTQRLATHDDLEERDADEEGGLTPAEERRLDELLAEEEQREDELHCAGVELAEEWA